MGSEWNLLLIFIVATTATSDLDSQVYEEDPCLRPRLIDDARRSPLHRPSGPREVLCDTNLEQGWYRFLVGGRSAEIPATCPGVSYCGTHAPVWLSMNGSREVAGEVLAHACVSAEILTAASSEPACCLYTWPLRVRRCERQGFTVYHLQPATTCNMAYCAQPQGEAQLFVGSPVITPVVRDNQVLLNCSFQTGEEFDDKDFRLSWFKVTSQGSHVSLTSEQPIRARHGLLDVARHLLPGEEVQCEVELMTDNFSVTSRPYFVGLHVTPSSVTLGPGRSEVTLEVTKTLPLGCSPGRDCGLKLGFVVRPRHGSRRRVSLSSCSTVLSENATSWVRAAAMPGAGHGHSELLVSVPSGAHAWWTQHPVIRVNLEVDSSPSKHCHVFTQAHVVAFNRHTFGLEAEGTFTLYRDVAADIEVEARVAMCGVGVAAVCVCGVAARQGRQAARLDTCGLSVPVLSVRGDEGEADTVRVLESRHGKILSLMFASGWMLRSHHAQFGLSLTLTSPTEVSSAATGLCVQHDNQVMGQPEEWRVPDSTSLLHTRRELQAEARDTWCECRERGDRSLPSCLPPSPPAMLRSFLDITEEALVGSQQTYNVVDHQGMTLTSDTDVYFEVHEMPLPSRGSSGHVVRSRGLGRGVEWDLGPGTPREEPSRHNNQVTEMEEHDAHALCLSALLNSSLGRSCAPLVTPEDLMSIIQICVSDVRSQGAAWARFSRPLLEDTCELRTWQAPPPGLADVLNCPEACSGHGVCLELGCICDPGFSKHDCSLLSEVAPKLSAVATDGRCDVASPGGCDKIAVQGEGFARSDLLTCRMTLAGRTNQSVATAAEFVSTNHVLCLLPREMRPLTELLSIVLSVSNTGGDHSNSLPLLLLDSRCVRCSEAGTCVARADVCVIGSTCHRAHEANPADPCLACRPNVANETWTSLNEPPRFTSQNETVTAISLRAFSGHEFNHRFTASDPEGGVLHFALTSPSSDLRLSGEGELRWRVPHEETRRALALVVTDSCNASASLRVVLVVSRCPCLNNGLCVQSHDGLVTCVCRRGFFGWRCERQEATSCSCGSHGRCVSGRSCRCDSGYVGTWCSRVINPCANNPCPRGATCMTLGPASYRCSICPWRNSARGRCEEVTSLPPTPRCASPCANGGRCVAHNTCACARGWSGPSCHSALCDPRCENGGVCWRPNKCSCPRGYRGRRCSKPICNPSCKGSGLKCIAPNVCHTKSNTLKPRVWFYQNPSRKINYYRNY